MFYLFLSTLRFALRHEEFHLSNSFIALIFLGFGQFFFLWLFLMSISVLSMFIFLFITMIVIIKHDFINHQYQCVASYEEQERQWEVLYL